MRGAITPLPQCAFMAWCLVKHGDNFTFTPIALPPGKVSPIPTGYDAESDGYDFYRHTRVYPKVFGLAAWSENCIYSTAFCP
jgi:hypothetical protein